MIRPKHRGARPRDPGPGPTVTHVPAVSVAMPVDAAPAHDPIDWALAERVATPRSAGASRWPRRTSPGRCATTSTTSPARPRRSSPTTRGCARRVPRGRRSSTAARGCPRTSRRCSACSRRSRRASASAWREPGRADRPAGRRHRDRRAARVPRAARARPVRPARARRRRAAADAVYYVGRQRPRAREAVRVPPARLPAVDRDPRGHAPGAVHRRAVDEALLPVAGRERARRRSIPIRGGIVQALAPRRRRDPQRAQPARRRRPRRAPRQRRAARRARQRAGADVVARGSRQQRHEPARARARRRAGAHGAGAAGPPPERGHGRVPAEARRSRVEDAPVRGGRDVRRGRRARGRARARSTRRGAARVPADRRRAQPTQPTGWLASTARRESRHRGRGGHRSPRGASGSPARCSGSTAPVVVACSGGADSVALLALARRRGPRTGRGARRPRRCGRRARTKPTACAAVATSSVPGSAVRAWSSIPGPNLEARARDARYAALEPCAASSSVPTCVARRRTRPTTRPRRCCSTCCAARPRPGSRGWPPRRDRIVRPLLGLPARRHARALRRARRSTSLDDPMNDDRAFRRVVRPARGAADARRRWPRATSSRCSRARPTSSVQSPSTSTSSRRAAWPDAEPAVGARRSPRCSAPLARRAVRRWLGAPPPSTAEVERVLAVAAGERRARPSSPAVARVRRAGGRLPLDAASFTCPWTRTRSARIVVSEDELQARIRELGQGDHRRLRRADRRCSSACSRARSCS